MAIYKRYRNKRICGTLHNCDSIDFLKRQKPNSADIIFIDPPFNIGKHYDDDKNKDKLPENEYFEFVKKIIDLSINALKDGGALYVYHIPRWAIPIANYCSQKLMFRHWISISMKNTLPIPNKLYPAHYALLYYTKGKPNAFVRPKTKPVSCRHCGELIKDYGGYLPIINKNGGINLSDVWDDLSPVRHKNSKSRQGNELPLELIHRILTISGYNGAKLLDPFIGSGTSAIACIDKGIAFSGCDRSKVYLQLAEDRISAALRGSQNA